MKKASLNHVFKLVWNQVLGAFVPVSELAKSSGKKNTLKPILVGGVLAVSGLSLQVSAAAPALVDGGGSGGTFVGSYFGGSNAVDVGNTTQQTIFTGFYTEGGAGSGGGAGLGGVFFVDQGASLTIINGVFIGNTVKGGEGGALPASRVGDTFINAAPFSLKLIGFEQQLATPNLVFNGVSGNYEFSSIGISSGTDILTAGSALSFDYLTGTPSATIVSKTSNSVVLNAPVEINNADVSSTVAGVNGVSSGYFITGNQITFYEQAPGDLTALLSNVAINGQIFIGGENAVIKTVNYGAGGIISSVILDRTPVNTAGALDVINVTKFDTQQFSLSGSDVTITGKLRGFQAGMQLFDGDGNSLNAKILTVSNDGASFTVDNPAGLAGVSTLTATKSPIVANNQIALTTPRSEIAVGVEVYVPDTGFFAIVTAYNASTGLITLDRAIDAGVLASVESGNPLTVAVRNVMDVTGDVLTIRKQAGQPLEAGMVINGTNIAADSTIENVVDNGSTYIVTLSAGSVQAAAVTSVVARSSLSQGGAMNNMTAVGNTGSNGNNGVNANYYSSFFDGGEGGEGRRGYSGDGGSTGAGFNGGNGGNGSDGLGANLQLITELYGATTDFTDSVGELAGAIAPDGFPPTPDYADIPFAIVDLAAKSISLATAIANTVFWGQNLDAGLAGLGGDGGEGGEAGGGAMFFGGGTGGDGGDGGEGARSYTDAGNGGDGGRGGDGGFGSGGGSGGGGGSAGTTGSANDGDAGDGGFAGFGAGDGSTGNGLYGGGGSGFGGAIFVREGGSLLIAGESLFENNVASGGSSNNRGAAGDGAGAAIFVMKGAAVTLSPGLGKTIRFEDEIADDSAATYEGASVAEGAGANITIAGDGGVVIFNAENTYTGDTILQGATLDAEFGEGIHYSSRLRFNGSGTVGGVGLNDLSLANVGTLLQGEDVTARRQGLRAHEITWSGSGGFASSNVDGIRINLGETINGIGQNLTWGNNGFFEGAANDSTLTFGSEQSLGAVTFENKVWLNNKNARVAVYNTGIEASSTATLSGNWYGGNLLIGSSTYSGKLYITGDNQLNNVTIMGGFTTTEGGGTLSTQANVANLTVSAGHIELIQNEFLGAVSVAAAAELSAVGAIITGAIDNTGVMSAIGGVVATSITNNANAQLNIFSDAVVSGVVENSADAEWNQQGDLTASDVGNNGQWNIFGLTTEDATSTITTNTLTGNGIFSLISTPQIEAEDVVGNLNIVQAGNSTFHGVISGAGAVEKAGVGVLKVSNTHTFSGGLNVTGGTFETLAPIQLTEGIDGLLGALPAPTSGGLLADTGAVHVFAGATFIAGNGDTVGSVEIDSNATFVMNAGITTQTNFTNNGLTAMTIGQILTTGGGLNGAGDITIGSAHQFTLAQTGNTTYSGTITGESMFVKEGAGKLTLAGVADSINIDTGISVDAGILSVDAVNALHSGQSLMVNAASFETLKDQRFSVLTVAAAGTVNNSAHMTTLHINNTGIVNTTGTITSDSITNQAGGDFNATSAVDVIGVLLNSDTADWSQQGNLSADSVVNHGDVSITGNATVMDSLLNSSGADWNQLGNLIADSVINNGDFGIAGTVTVAGSVHNSGAAQVGDLAPGAVTGAEANSAPAEWQQEGNLTADSLTNDGTWGILGSVSVTNEIFNSTAAEWSQVGDATADSILNNGQWNIFGFADTDGTSTLTVNTLTGYGTFSLMDLPDSGGILTVGNMDIVQAGTSTFDGVITGAGSVEKKGAGTLRVSNTQTFTGGLDVSGGTFETLAPAALLEGTDGLLGAQPAPTSGGLLADTVAVRVLDGGRFIAGNNDSIGSVSISSNGTFVLNANISTQTNFTNNGLTSVANSQTLTTGGGLQGAGNITVADAAQLTLAQTGSSTYSGTMIGDGSLYKDGAGTLTLSGVQDSIDLKGGITINGGVLSLNGANILAASSNVLVNGGGTLDLASGNQRINELTGVGIIDLHSNILSVENGGVFAGEVIGEGSLDITQGVFSVNNAITATTGSFNVKPGATTIVANGASLKFPAITVQQGGTLDVAGIATADNNLMVASNSTLHLGTLTTKGNVQTPTASLYGTVSGNGAITGNSTAYAGAILAPGNSPGVLTFDNLTIDSGATASMQITSPGVAGQDFDQIIVNGQLVLAAGSALDIIKYITDPAAVELAMGDTVKIFNFAPGAVTGQFGTVTSSYDNDVIYNVATGEVVGLGDVDAATFKSTVGNTKNRSAMLADLLVNSAGGVDQFYGGNLMTNVAAAYGNQTALDTVFAKASPEMYSALLDQSRLAVVSDLSAFSINPETAKQGVSVSYTDGENSTDNGHKWAAYDLKSSITQISYTHPYEGGAVRVSVSNDDRDVESDFMTATTNGQTFNIAAAHTLPIQELRVLANVSMSDYRSDARRTTLSSESFAKDVDSSSKVISVGIGYAKNFDSVQFDSSINVMDFDAKVDGFTEINGQLLDTLAVEKQEVSGQGFLLKAGVVKQLSESWQLGSELSYLSMNDAEDYDVVSHVNVEATSFTVANPGIGSDLLNVELSAKYNIKDNWNVSLETNFGGSNGIGTDMSGKLSVNYLF